MNHKLRVLGLCLLAVCAVGAVSANAASAAIEFTGIETTEPTTGEHVGHHVETNIFGEDSGTHAFTAGEGFGSISCKHATFTGSAPGTSTTVTISPEYKECSDSFGRAVDVSVNGCKYRFHATAKTETDHYTGDVDVICEETKKIEVKVTSGGSVICTVTIGSQENRGPIDFTNMTESDPTDVTVNSTANNIINETSGGFFNCGISNGKHEKGTYTGNTTVTGKNGNNEPIDVEVSG